MAFMSELEDNMGRLHVWSVSKHHDSCCAVIHASVLRSGTFIDLHCISTLAESVPPTLYIRRIATRTAV